MQQYCTELHAQIPHCFYAASRNKGQQVVILPPRIARGAYTRTVAARHMPKGPLQRSGPKVNAQYSHAQGATATFTLPHIFLLTFVRSSFGQQDDDLVQGVNEQVEDGTLESLGTYRSGLFLHSSTRTFSKAIIHKRK